MNTSANVVVITGGAKGIGRACAERFVRDGWHVAILDRDETEGRALAAALGDNARFFPCDILQEHAIDRAMADTVAALGEIGVLVNSAGIQRYSTVTETTEQEWDLVLGVNLKGAFLAARHAIPSMLRRGRGCVINLASVNALHCQKNTAPYATSKAGLLGLTRSIAVDYAPQVRAVAVCPGAVDTPMLQEALADHPERAKIMEDLNRMHLPGRIAKADEIAGLIAYLCSDDAAFITGHEIRIDGGLGIQLGGN